MFNVFYLSFVFSWHVIWPVISRVLLNDHLSFCAEMHAIRLLLLDFEVMPFTVIWNYYLLVERICILDLSQTFLLLFKKTPTFNCLNPNERYLLEYVFWLQELIQLTTSDERISTALICFRRRNSEVSFQKNL